MGVALGTLGLSGAGIGVAASRYEAVLQKGAVVGVVPVGGLTPDEAKKRVRLWWEGERNNVATFKSAKLSRLPKDMQWDELGLYVDDAKSIEAVPLTDFMGAAQESVGMRSSEESRFPLVFGHDATKVDPIDDLVKKDQPPKKEARVFYSKGKVKYQFEEAGYTLDKQAFSDEIIQSFQDADEVDIPLTIGPKRIPDEMLKKIVEPMATFSTRFPASNRPRCANIQLAASIINGKVLMPGEKFSFNDVVGQRTLKRGFKTAGVYVNGRHDEGVGGGICQVSTTLYNAVLMSNLKVHTRRNHSLSVAYVPIGRDASVSYGTLDLVFENTMPFPIAVDSVYSPGQLTFTVMGIKDDSISISIERGKVKSWSRGEKVIHDPNLPYGRTVLVDKGGPAHQVQTWRVIKQNGKVIARESLGTSYYPGGPRIYARNMKAKPRAAETPAGAVSTRSEAASSVPPRVSPPPSTTPPLPSGAGSPN